jgi:hypothetical protein
VHTYSKAALSLVFFFFLAPPPNGADWGKIRNTSLGTESSALPLGWRRCGHSRLQLQTPRRDVGRPEMAPSNVRTAASDRCHGPQPLLASPQLLAQPAIRLQLGRHLPRRASFACDPRLGTKQTPRAVGTSACFGKPSMARYAALVRPCLPGLDLPRRVRSSACVLD